MIYELTDIRKLFTIGEYYQCFDGLQSNLTYDLNDPLESPTALKKPTKKKKSQDTRSKMYDNAVLISCGNCGINHEDINLMKELENLNELLVKNNSFLFFIHGRHDNPNSFNGELINFSNIKAIEDYSVIRIKDFNVLCVGGELTPNRLWLQQHEKRLAKLNGDTLASYWKEEMPIYKEDVIDNIIQSGISINAVVSTLPPFTIEELIKNGVINKKQEPLYSMWFESDKSLKEDMETMQQVFPSILKRLTDKECKLVFWACASSKLTSYLNSINHDECYLLHNDYRRINDVKRCLASFEKRKEMLKNTIKLKKADLLSSEFMSTSSCTDDVLEAVDEAYDERIRPHIEPIHFEAPQAEVADVHMPHLADLWDRVQQERRMHRNEGIDRIAVELPHLDYDGDDLGDLLGENDDDDDIEGEFQDGRIVDHILEDMLTDEEVQAIRF